MPGGKKTKRKKNTYSNRLTYGTFRTAPAFGMLVFVFASTAQAILVRIEESGTIDRITDKDHILTDLVSVGQSFTVWYELDTNAPDLAPGATWLGRYKGIRSGLSLPNFNSDGIPDIQVVTTNGGWLVFGWGKPDWSFRSDLYLMNVPLPNDQFPWPLPQFQPTPFGVGFYGGSDPKGESFSGQVTRVSATEIPEPTCLISLLAGVAVALGRSSTATRLLSR